MKHVKTFEGFTDTIKNLFKSDKKKYDIIQFDGLRFKALVKSEDKYEIVEDYYNGYYNVGDLIRNDKGDLMLYSYDFGLHYSEPHKFDSVEDALRFIQDKYDKDQKRGFFRDSETDTLDMLNEIL